MLDELPLSLKRDYTSVYGLYSEIGKSKIIKKSPDTLIDRWKKSKNPKGWVKTPYPTLELWIAINLGSLLKINVVILDLDKQTSHLLALPAEGYSVIYHNSIYPWYQYSQQTTQENTHE